MRRTQDRLQLTDQKSPLRKSFQSKAPSSDRRSESLLVSSSLKRDAHRERFRLTGGDSNLSNSILRGNGIIPNSEKPCAGNGNGAVSAPGSAPRGVRARGGVRLSDPNAPNRFGLADHGFDANRLSRRESSVRLHPPRCGCFLTRRRGRSEPPLPSP